jgi:hypothetical protein
MHLKVKFTLKTAMEAQREVEVQLHSFLYIGARGGWLSTIRPGRFIPGKQTRYGLYRRLGGPQSRSGRVQKISPQPVFDPRTVWPVASRYIDYAIPAHTYSYQTYIISLYTLSYAFRL